MDGARELRAKVLACACSASMAGVLGRWGPMLELLLGVSLRSALLSENAASGNEKGRQLQCCIFRIYV